VDYKAADCSSWHWQPDDYTSLHGAIIVDLVPGEQATGCYANLRARCHIFRSRRMSLVQNTELLSQREQYPTYPHKQVIQREYVAEYVVRLYLHGQCGYKNRTVSRSRAGRRYWPLRQVDWLRVLVTNVRRNLIVLRRCRPLYIRAAAIKWTPPTKAVKSRWRWLLTLNYNPIEKQSLWLKIYTVIVVTDVHNNRRDVCRSHTLTDVQLLTIVYYIYERGITTVLFWLPASW